jgi:nucleotide-binding universal stress UspA family protein
MFKKILLPVDLTERYEPALKAATELATQSGGEVVVLHVIEVIAGFSVDEEKDFYRRIEQSAREHLARLAQALKQKKVRARVEVRVGKRAAEVAQYARDIGSDLIVFTAPQFDPSQGLAGWGSLSFKVALLAPCPVLLMK